MIKSWKISSNIRESFGRDGIKDDNDFFFFKIALRDSKQSEKII